MLSLVRLNWCHASLGVTCFKVLGCSLESLLNGRDVHDGNLDTFQRMWCVSAVIARDKDVGHIG